MTASYTNTFKNQGGFTVVEFLVVFTISAILIAVALPAINSFNRLQVLKTTAQELKSNIRSAQNKALSGEKACSPTIDDQKLYSLLGWYVRFDPTIDPITKNPTYTIGHHCVSASTGNDLGVEYSERTYQLKGVSTITFTPIDVRTILYKPVTNIVSFYKVSSPLAFLSGSEVVTPQLTITLSLVDGSTTIGTSVLTISQSGEINVQ